MTEIISQDTPVLRSIRDWFTSDSNELIFMIKVHESKPAHQFYRDDTHSESYEKNGVTYNITRNNSRWAAVWMKDNIECFLTADCHEDTLRRILGSIYVMEAQ